MQAGNLFEGTGTCGRARGVRGVRWPEEETEAGPFELKETSVTGRSKGPDVCLSPFEYLAGRRQLPGDGGDLFQVASESY